MASSLYDKAREEYLGAVLDWDADDVRCCLVRSAYTFSAAHTSMSDIGANDNGRSAALASKTVTGGVADAADTTLTATGANACNAMVIFKHTGTDSTARLIVYLELSEFTPSASQNVDIAFDNGANKIFKL